MGMGALGFMEEGQNIIYQNLHNPSNRLLSFDDLKEIFNRADILDKFSEKGINIYNFDLSNFQKALTHISYTVHRKKKQGKNTIETEADGVDINICVPIQEHSMEREEWLGDALIQSIVAIYLWKRFPMQDEGFYTQTRSKLVKTSTLGKFGEYLGFNKLLLINKHLDDFCNGRNNPKHLEDAFEAFIGVLYIETEKYFGNDLVSLFILNLIEKVIDMPMLIMYNDNYKDQLMRYYQNHFGGKYPTYQEVKVEEIQCGDKKKIFTMSVNDAYGTPIAYGTAKSKKEAEQISAKEACKHFGLHVSEGVNYYNF